MGSDIFLSPEDRKKREPASMPPNNGINPAGAADSQVYTEVRWQR
ncbi:MAG: hypothetical protein WAU01_03125 [Saprospiraceae bacterium]